MDEKTRYILKKDYVTDHGALHQNSEIRLFRGAVFYDGGLVPTAYAKELVELVEDEKLKEEYIKEVKANA